MVTATIDNVISFAGTRSVEVDRLPIERRVSCSPGWPGT